MTARRNNNWWLYNEMDSLLSLVVRRMIEDFVTQLSGGYSDQSFKIRIMKRLLKDALNDESPTLLLEEIGEIVLAASQAGVPKKILLTSSYEQIVKATITEARKAPRFKQDNLYCKD